MKIAGECVGVGYGSRKSEFAKATKRQGGSMLPLEGDNVAFTAPRAIGGIAVAASIRFSKETKSFGALRNFANKIRIKDPEKAIEISL